MVEHLPFKEGVDGSSPSGLTIYTKIKMNNNSDVNSYLENGFYNGSTLFTGQEISDLRANFEKSFSKKKYPRSLSLFEIVDHNSIKTVLKAFESQAIDSFVKNIGQKLNTKTSILPLIFIQRNYHVDRYKTEGVGWHRDCGGELFYDYCKKILYDKSYIMGKVGIYMQENKKYGGSIDVIPKSHIYYRFKNFILSKFKSVPLKIISFLHSKIPFLYRLIPENFYMKLLNAKKMNPAIGSPVFFDNRLVHRGSPIEDTVRKNVSFAENISAETPIEKTKFSIYAFFGSTLACDSYMYDRLKRKNNSHELQKWHDLQKKIENFSPNLASESKNILNDIFSKYSEFVKPN